MRRPKFLVTGATSDTGRYATEKLRRQGHSVPSLVYKHDEWAERLKGLGAEVIVGDLLNLEDVRCALAGIPPRSPIGRLDLDRVPARCVASSKKWVRGRPLHAFD
jgi:uncharacterized protein YbjT (DUF2867 family)